MKKNDENSSRYKITVKFQNESLNLRLIGLRSRLKINMSEESSIFEHISKNEITELKAKLTAHNGSVDFTDENGELLRILGKAEES